MGLARGSAQLAARDVEEGVCLPRRRQLHPLATTAGQRKLKQQQERSQPSPSATQTRQDENSLAASKYERR